MIFCSGLISSFGWRCSVFATFVALIRARRRMVSFAENGNIFEFLNSFLKNVERILNLFPNSFTIHF